MSAGSEWQRQYTTDESVAHHRQQNHAIVNDFLIHMIHRPKKKFIEAFNSASVIVEHGCGTGEFIAEIASKAPYAKCLGFDFSPEAISLATEYKKQVPNVEYAVHDLNDESMPESGASLCIISNVIEHFKHWTPVVENLLDSYEQLLIIVPYEERIDCIPGPAAMDGGGGHCHSFNKNSFMRHEIVDDFVFFSLNGWGVSHAGECPLLYAALIRRKSNG